MRLINARTLRLESFHDPVQKPYAILSHTWEGDEVTFEDMKDLTVARKKTASFSKIKTACRTALGQGLDYVWVDTCCIDKSSSAELSEAINSMFRWYKNAAYCLAFLSDLPTGNLLSTQDGLRNCRWLSRGWTLQELIAPADVVFYDADWNPLGTKNDIAEELEAITGIDQDVLKGRMSLEAISLAKRMSWAAQRQTTRVEDMAYCLLGIFDVNMPMLYGEGSRAFARLQEEILKKTTDLSLFAWIAKDDSEYHGILAESPADFFQCGKIHLNDGQFSFRDEISITNKGVKIYTPIHHLMGSIYTMNLSCYERGNDVPIRLAIYLKRVMDTYFRHWPQSFTGTTPKLGDRIRPIYLALTSQNNTSRAIAYTGTNRQISVKFKRDTKAFRMHNIKAVPDAFWHADEYTFSIKHFRHFMCFVRFCVTSKEFRPRGGCGQSTVFVLVCKLDDYRMHLTLYMERDDNIWEPGVINPFTNIEEYGPLGDPSSLYALIPDSREVRSLLVKHEDSDHNYTVEASLAVLNPLMFPICIQIERIGQC